MSVVGLALGLVALPSRASAYGVDVHFNLTYVLCRLAGMEAKDAIWVAAADQSMDDNDCTSAYRGVIWWTTHQDLSWKNGKAFHDFSDANKVYGTDVAPELDPSIKEWRVLSPGKTIVYSDGGISARQHISDRLKQLRDRIPLSYSEEDQRIIADIALGQYLHAKQDWYSHRQFNQDQGVNDKFLPFGPIAGHACEGDRSCADYVALRPTLATTMAIETWQEVTRFLKARNQTSNSVSEAKVRLLIVNLSNTYHVQGGSTTRLSETAPTSRMSPPEDQDKINAALRSCLAQDPVIALPSYTYALPFDGPDAVLGNIKLVVQGMLDRAK